MCLLLDAIVPLFEARTEDAESADAGPRCVVETGL